MAECMPMCHNRAMFRIAEVRKNLGIKAVDLADAIDISQPYLSQIENGKRRPSAAMLQDIASFLGVPIRTLYANEQRIAVAGRVGAGARVELVDAYEKGDGLYHIACPDDLLATGIVAVEIKGNSMEPLMFEGDILLFTRHFLGVDPAVVGRVGICETEDGRALVKQIREGRDPGTFDLYSFNSASNGPEYGVRLHWAAPYRRHLRSEDIEIL
jgi:transcriptional regulator with XRE-family HTH domain